MKKSMAHTVYTNKKFIEDYSKNAETNFFNAHLERPATLSLLPDVNGKTVLDAGCGAGIYSEILYKKGATVKALDYSHEMLRLARERVPEGVAFIEQDLNQALPYPDKTFDVVLCSFAVHYVKDWVSLFNEFSRVTKSRGLVVFSTIHPIMDVINLPDCHYFETQTIKELWDSYEVWVESTRRPFADFFKIFEETGFIFDKMIEPQPLPEAKEKFPGHFEKYSKIPHSIVFRIIKK